MDKLIQHTGGIFIIHMCSVLLSMVVLIIVIVSWLIRITKNKEISKKEKIEYYILVISVIFIAMWIGYMIGFNAGMYTML